MDKLSRDRPTTPTYRPTTSNPIQSSSAPSSVANAFGDSTRLHRSPLDHASRPSDDRGIEAFPHGSELRQVDKAWDSLERPVSGKIEPNLVDNEDDETVPAYEPTAQAIDHGDDLKGNMAHRERVAAVDLHTSSRATAQQPRGPSSSSVPSSSGDSSRVTTSTSAQGLTKQPSLQNVSALEAALDSGEASPMLDSPADSISKMPFPLDVESSPCLLPTDNQSTPKTEPLSPDDESYSLHTPSEIGRKLLGPRPMGLVSRNNSILSTSDRRPRPNLPAWPGSSSLPDEKHQPSSLAHAHRRYSSVSQDERFKVAYRPSMPSIHSAPSRIEPLSPPRLIQDELAVDAIEPERDPKSAGQIHAWRSQTKVELRGSDKIASLRVDSPPPVQREHADDSEVASAAAAFEVPSIPHERSVSEPILEHPSAFPQWSRLSTNAQDFSAVEAYALPPAMAYQTLQKPVSALPPATQSQAPMYGEPTSYILSSTGQPIPVYAPPQIGPLSTRSLPRLSVPTGPPACSDQTWSPVPPLTVPRPILKQPTSSSISQAAPLLAMTTPSTTTDSMPSKTFTRVESSLITAPQPSIGPIGLSSNSFATNESKSSTDELQEPSAFSKWSTHFKNKVKAPLSLSKPTVKRPLKTDPNLHTDTTDDPFYDPFQPRIQRSSSVLSSTTNHSSSSILENDTMRPCKMATTTTTTTTTTDDSNSLHVRFKSPVPSISSTSTKSNSSNTISTRHVRNGTRSIGRTGTTTTFPVKKSTFSTRFGSTNVDNLGFGQDCTRIGQSTEIRELETDERQRRGK
ncbi:hypothetical protein OIV83_004682 [Microbotryomycetes sp. JL201]|nr:hypothetical protein OIV83_004682 [Microbotryomycetes sp. JL201]